MRAFQEKTWRDERQQYLNSWLSDRPRLRRKGQRWECTGRGVTKDGSDPAGAYWAWRWSAMPLLQNKQS